MSINFKELPYTYDDLSPFISSETLKYHHGEHYKGYVNKLNDMIKGNKDFENAELEDIIKNSAGYSDLKPIYNNAAQVWNHEFYWQSMTNNDDNKIIKNNYTLFKLVKKDFSSDDGQFQTSLKKLKSELFSASVGYFGSGWTWLIYNIKKNSLEIVSSSNADNFLGDDNRIPLITIDVWEHSYYIDYRNKRPDYIQMFLDNLINFNFAELNLNKALDN